MTVAAYGQGMSVAALESLALQNCLAQGRRNLRSRFFKEAGKVVDVPWNMVVNNDLQVTQAGGTRSLQVRFLNWYMSKVLIAAQNDRVVAICASQQRFAIAFLRVSNLMASPQSLMHPIYCSKGAIQLC